MTEPIEYLAKRYRCPHCRKSLSARSRMVAHMARCWANPDQRGCKTCRHFAPPTAEESDHCEQGVDLSGVCPACGRRHDGSWSQVSTECQTCHGWPKAGPITDCKLWEAA